MHAGRVQPHPQVASPKLQICSRVVSPGVRHAERRLFTGRDAQGQVVQVQPARAKGRAKPSAAGRRRGVKCVPISAVVVPVLTAARTSLYEIGSPLSRAACVSDNGGSWSGGNEYCPAPVRYGEGGGGCIDIGPAVEFKGEDVCEASEPDVLERFGEGSPPGGECIEGGKL